jgi:hypothetical protein
MVFIAIKRELIGRKQIDRIGIFSIGFLAFVLIRDILINALDYTFWLSDIVFLFKYLYLCYIFCLILGDKAFAYIVKVITDLTIISFFFYAIQLVAGQLMYDAFRLINLPNDNVLSNNLAGSYSNILIFTFTKDFHDYTNSGFVWEPGSFGCFLVIALMFHFFLNKFKLDKTAYILIIGNITTFSTTNYLGLIILLFLAYRYRVPKFNIMLLVSLAIFIALILTIPFLGQKIVQTYDEDMGDLKQLRILERYYHHYRMQIPLNRFASMVYIFQTFQYQLILGVSNKYSQIFYRSFNVNVSNGVFDFLAKFGLVGLVYLLYHYTRICLKYVVKKEFAIYCILILLVLGFGEPIMILPLVLNFLFLPLAQTSIINIKPRFEKIYN